VDPYSQQMWMAVRSDKQHWLNTVTHILWYTKDLQLKHEELYVSSVSQPNKKAELQYTILFQPFAFYLLNRIWNSFQLHFLVSQNIILVGKFHNHCEWILMSERKSVGLKMNNTILVCNTKVLTSSTKIYGTHALQ
jgi:hypothetical protein